MTGDGKRTTLIIIGVAAACVFVVLLLGFAVGPKWFTGGNKQPSGPEQTMNSFYQALIDGDAPALVSLMDPASLQQLKSALSSGGFKSMEQYMQTFLKQINPQGDLRITDLTYRTTISGEQATVEVTGGKATYTDAQGNAGHGDAGERGDPLRPEAVQPEERGRHLVHRAGDVTPGAIPAARPIHPSASRAGRAWSTSGRCRASAPPPASGRAGPS